MLLKELKDFEDTLSEVKQKGHLVVATSGNPDEVKEVVDGQIASLEENYHALQVTLTQSQDRLRDIQERWSGYETQLNDCEAYLQNTSAPWLENVASSRPQTLQDATDQHQEAKVSGEKEGVI